MKSLLTIFSVFLFFGINSCAESKNSASATVKDAFEKKFPNASEAEWEEDSDKEWEVEFILNDEEYSAAFSSNGKWLETERFAMPDELPQSVLNTLETQFTGYDIEEIMYVESAEGNFYEMEIENEETEMEIAISPTGNLLESEQEDDDDDEEDDEDDDDHDDDEEGEDDNDEEGEEDDTDDGN